MHLYIRWKTKYLIYKKNHCTRAASLCGSLSSLFRRLLRLAVTLEERLNVCGRAFPTGVMKTCWCVSRVSLQPRPAALHVHLQPVHLLPVSELPQLWAAADGQGQTLHCRTQKVPWFFFFWNIYLWFHVTTIQTLSHLFLLIFNVISIFLKVFYIFFFSAFPFYSNPLCFFAESQSSLFVCLSLCFIYSARLEVICTWLVRH